MARNEAQKGKNTSKNSNKMRIISQAHFPLAYALSNTIIIIIILRDRKGTFEDVCECVWTRVSISTFSFDVQRYTSLCVSVVFYAKNSHPNGWALNYNICLSIRCLQGKICNANKTICCCCFCECRRNANLFIANITLIWYWFWSFFFPLLFMHTAASVHGVRLCVLCSCVRCMLFFFSCDKLRGKLCNIFCQQHPLASSVSFWCERAHSQCIEKHSLAIDNESEQKMRIYTLYSKWILIYELCIRI